MQMLLKNLLRKVTKVLFVTLALDPAHPMVFLCNHLDWDHLMKIVEKYRNKKIKNDAGKKPHLRILLGAIIVRVLKSCTLRDAADLMRHYGPARYLCGLENSRWNPNFRTLWDFEDLLGSEGLREINNYILQIARALGFVDIKGLCSDTTAQEAQIPYPNEVGLMGSFAKTIMSAVTVLKGKAGNVVEFFTVQVNKIKKLVRKHRLFCKTKEAKRQVEKALLNCSKQLCQKVHAVVKYISEKSIQKLRGHQKTAYSRMKNISEIFKKLAPQINYYIRKGTATKGKIVSLFLPLVKSIVRGKAGKKVEFGLKWAVNQIRGGYISIFRVGTKADQDCAVMGVEHHIDLFGKAPDELGYDRGGWSEPHIKKIKELGVKRVGIAPKGKAKWKVSDRCKERLTRERAQVEGKIGTIKHYEFNRPNAKTTAGMERSALRSALRFNMTKLTKDLGKK